METKYICERKMNGSVLRRVGLTAFSFARATYCLRPWERKMIWRLMSSPSLETYGRQEAGTVCSGYTCFSFFLSILNWTLYFLSNEEHALPSVILLLPWMLCGQISKHWANESFPLAIIPDSLLGFAFWELLYLPIKIPNVMLSSNFFMDIRVDPQEGTPYKRDTWTSKLVQFDLLNQQYEHGHYFHLSYGCLWSFPHSLMLISSMLKTWRGNNGVCGGRVKVWLYKFQGVLSSTFSYPGLSSPARNCWAPWIFCKVVTGLCPDYLLLLESI